MKRILVALVLGLFVMSAAVGCGSGSPTKTTGTGGK
jgi:hypothetical protein